MREEIRIEVKLENRIYTSTNVLYDSNLINLIEKDNISLVIEDHFKFISLGKISDFKLLDISDWHAVFVGYINTSLDLDMSKLEVKLGFMNERNFNTNVVTSKTIKSVYAFLVDKTLEDIMIKLLETPYRIITTKIGKNNEQVLNAHIKIEDIADYLIGFDTVKGTIVTDDEDSTNGSVMADEEQEAMYVVSRAAHNTEGEIQ